MPFILIIESNLYAGALGTMYNAGFARSSVSGTGAPLVLSAC
jgi:hypothetical protein